MMICADAECGYRHCTVCGHHLDAGELTNCWACIGKTRRDLIAIADLVALLPDHARHGSSGGHLLAAQPLLGGDATVMLGRGSEGLSEDGSTNPGDPEPPAFLLGWWTEAWREALGLDSKLPVWQRLPELVIAEAQTFLGDHLGWAAANHAGFRQFARDLAASRRQLEGLLRAGDRPMTGVCCFECGGVLERVYRPRRPCSCPAKTDVGVTGHALWEENHRGHDQGGLHDPSPDAGWACPACQREYSPGEYALAVSTAYDAAAEWRGQVDATRLTGCPRGTVQVWASRGQIRRRKNSSGRVVYSLSDIRARMADDIGLPVSDSAL